MRGSSLGNHECKTDETRTNLKEKIEKRQDVGRCMVVRKKEREAVWRPIALLWARSNLMEDKGRLHTRLPPPAYLLPTSSLLPPELHACSSRDSNLYFELPLTIFLL